MQTPPGGSLFKRKVVIWSLCFFVAVTLIEAHVDCYMQSSRDGESQRDLSIYCQCPFCGILWESFSINVLNLLHAGSSLEVCLGRIPISKAGDTVTLDLFVDEKLL